MLMFFCKTESSAEGTGPAAEDSEHIYEAIKLNILKELPPTLERYGVGIPLVMS